MSSPSGSSFWGRYRNELGLLVAIIAVVALTTWVSDSYRKRPVQNAQEILRQTAMLGIFALGAATVIIAGGIDLSSGSVIAFSATACSSIILLLAPIGERGEPETVGLPLWVLLAAFAGTIFLAFLVGSFHAWLITAIDLPPFVATLASLVGLRSLSRLIIENVTRVAYDKSTGSSKIYVRDKFFKMLGSEWWIPLLVFGVLAFLLWLLLTKTVVGRHLHAMGGNEEAAKLSGIRTARLKWLAYCIGTVTAAIAGILQCSYVSQAEPVNDGMGYELSAIAAAVVGGCSLTGGLGTVPGVILGATFLRVVIDAVAKCFTQSPDKLEGLVVGSLVVLAVAFNALRGRSGERKTFFAGPLGYVTAGILVLLAGVIAYVTVTDPSHKTWFTTAAVLLTGAVVGARIVLERLRDRSAQSGQ